MRIIHALPAAILSTFVFQLGVGFSNDDCPGINQATHKAPPYDFTFESWVQKNKKGNIYIFGRCVQTKNNVDLWVDWTGTGVKGFAIPGWPCLHEIPSPTSDDESVKTDLWYGAAPDKIQAPYREVKPTASGTATVELQSRVKMAIPHRVARTEEEAGGLTKLDMRFFSSVEKHEANYIYTYRWEAREPSKGKEASIPFEGKPVAFRWAADSFLKSLQRNHPSAKLEVAGKAESWEVRASMKPIYGTTIVEFLDGDGERVVASAPVAVYHPLDDEKK